MRAGGQAAWAMEAVANPCPVPSCGSGSGESFGKDPRLGRAEGGVEGNVSGRPPHRSGVGRLSRYLCGGWD